MSIVNLFKGVSTQCETSSFERSNDFSYATRFDDIKKVTLGHHRRSLRRICRSTTTTQLMMMIVWSTKSLRENDEADVARASSNTTDTF